MGLNLDELEKYLTIHHQLGLGNPMRLHVSEVRHLIADARAMAEAREILTEMIDCDTCLGTGGSLDDPCTNCAKARAWLSRHPETKE